MRAIRSEERTSYEKAVYHIKRMNVKEKFFRSSANEARTLVAANKTGSAKTLTELAASRECIKRCIQEKKLTEIRERKFLHGMKLGAKPGAGFAR